MSDLYLKLHILSGPSGLITEKHKAKLTECQQKLNTIRFPGRIARCLQSKGVFIDQEVEAVETAKTETEKAQQLVDLIKKSDDIVFYEFIDALKETNHHGLATILDDRDIPGNKRKSKRLRGRFTTIFYMYMCMKTM